MMAPGMRMEKNHASNDRKPRAVCFFTANRRSHGHCHPLFKDFPAFFSRSICHSYVLIVIRAKISLIRFLLLFFLFFFFSYIGFGWIITMFFFRSKDIVAITFHFDFERWRDFGEMWVVTILLMFQSVA